MGWKFTYRAVIPDKPNNDKYETVQSSNITSEVTLSLLIQYKEIIPGLAQPIGIPNDNRED